MRLSQLLPRPLLVRLRLWQRRAWRRAFARSYYQPQFALIERWLFESNETSNFTYDLTALNRDHLAAFVAHIVGISQQASAGYLAELDADDELREHIRRETLQHEAAGSGPAETDLVQHYGRRLGWYALVRAHKPRVVVETGVANGLGACVLCAALRRNAAEGTAGRYYGTEIDPAAGYLFGPPYSDMGTILYGDSLKSLETLDESIDLFINDSDHSADYEAREYQAIRGKLSPRALLLADNAHATDKLSEFAQDTGHNFLFWREQPKDHWYPGGGIGVAFCRVSSEQAATPKSNHTINEQRR